MIKSFQSFTAIFCTIILNLGVSACGTPPSGVTENPEPEKDVVTAEGAASAAPGYRVKGAHGLLNLGIDLF